MPAPAPRQEPEKPKLAAPINLVHLSVTPDLPDSIILRPALVFLSGKNRFLPNKQNILINIRGIINHEKI